MKRKMFKEKTNQQRDRRLNRPLLDLTLFEMDRCSLKEWRCEFFVPNWKFEIFFFSKNKTNRNFSLTKLNILAESFDQRFSSFREDRHSNRHLHWNRRKSQRSTIDKRVTREPLDLTEKKCSTVEIRSNLFDFPKKIRRKNHFDSLKFCTKRTNLNDYRSRNLRQSNRKFVPLEFSFDIVRRRVSIDHRWASRESFDRRSFDRKYRWFYRH